MDDLRASREHFPILGQTTYLISHSLGAMPRRVYDRLQEYAETWATRGIRAWAEGWWEMPVTTGDKLARILGAAPGSVVMHQNVSVCQSIILSCFDLAGRRNKIVYEALNFPSVMYVYEAHARAAGGRVVEVPSEDGVTIDTGRLLEAIDEETLLVPVSHVLFKSAYIQDARAIVERAHRVGALVVLDVYQSARTNAEGVLRDEMKTADTPELVATAVVKAATDANPRRRYATGRLARQVSLLRRFAPASAFDKSLRKQMRLPA